MFDIIIRGGDVVTPEGVVRGDVAIAGEVTTYAEYADVLEDSPAKVTLTLNDGRKIERSKYYPSGSMQVPMSPAQTKAKFDICAAQAIDNSAAEKLYVMLSTIGEQPSFAEFWPLLRKG